MTPLHFAASRGHQNALLLLLDAGSCLEPRNSSLNTPLHLAAQNGHEGCVKALIYDAERCGKKLHISARNQKGDTALHFASRWGFQSIAQILVEHGAAIRIHNIRHVTPLDCAHDIHILKILQRSLRRRSLVEVNHGDFINIEMVQKEETGGIVMLITEPKEPETQRETSVDKNVDNNKINKSGNNSRPTSLYSSRVPSRKTSVSAMPDLIPATSMISPGLSPGNVLSSTRSRKSSSIINPMKGINEETTKCLLQDVVNLLEHPRLVENEERQQSSAYQAYPGSNNNNCDNNYLSVVSVNPGGEEVMDNHLRKISVQSLEECRIASADVAFTGLFAVEDTTGVTINYFMDTIFFCMKQNEPFSCYLFFVCRSRY